MLGKNPTLESYHRISVRQVRSLDFVAARILLVRLAGAGWSRVSQNRSFNPWIKDGIDEFGKEGLPNSPTTLSGSLFLNWRL
jgi:hypothetical protein